MQDRRRAQVAMEFMLLAAFFMVVLVVVLAYFSSIQAREIQDREYAIGREIAARMADEVHASVVAGEGYQTKFNVPAGIGGRYPYDLVLANQKVSFASAFVEINWTESGQQFEYSIPLATRNLCNGAPAAGSGCAKPITDGSAMKLDRSKAVNLKNNGDWIYVWQN
jgi:hypothetical protein